MNISSSRINSLKNDLNWAWNTRFQKIEFIDGDMVEVEMTDMVERMEAVNTFTKSIDPENYQLLREIWKSLPDHYSLNGAAHYIMGK